MCIIVLCNFTVLEIRIYIYNFYLGTNVCIYLPAKYRVGTYICPLVQG